MKFQTAIAAAAAMLGTLSVAGCAGDRPVAESASVQRAPLDELPAPSDPYVIAPFDVLKIEVYGVPEMTRSVELDSEGQFIYPFVGSVDANGKSISEITKFVEDGLRDRYVRNPQVSIITERAAGRQIFVGGEVTRPGQFQVNGKVTLAQSVMLAGGTSEYAKLDDVIVMRDIDGTRWLGLYNLTAVSRGNYPDPQIYPGDTIIVGDSPGRRALLEIISFIPLITQPIIAYDRIAN